ncbi:MAG: hypothetical protein ACR2PL_08745 [Dehalococcoidia bacterium]
MMTYTTFDHDTIDVSGLTPEQKAFLKHCIAAYRAGADGHAISQMAESSDNPLIRDSGGRFTSAVVQHPLYFALSDLEYRADVDNQADEPSDAEQDELTCQEAARTRHTIEVAES